MGKEQKHTAETKSNCLSCPFYSDKNKQTFRYRSRLELHWYQLLEEMTRVKHYYSEPVMVPYKWKGSIYYGVSDLRIRYADGATERIKIIPEDVLMKSIVVCGIPRSGSTLVGQIFQEVFSDLKIPKIHPTPHELPSEDALVAITIRDPRDVVASLYRVRMSRGGEDVGGRKGLETVVIQAHKHFGTLSKIQSRNKNILLRYEDFVHDYDIIYEALLKLTGILVPEKDRCRINNKFSLEANRERASRLKDFNEIGEYEIHGDHIGPVEPGTWVTSLPTWAVGMVEDVCDTLCKEWGYED